MKRWLRIIAWGALGGAVIGLLDAIGVFDVINRFWPSRAHLNTMKAAWDYPREEYFSHFLSYPLWWGAFGAVAAGLVTLWLDRDKKTPTGETGNDKKSGDPNPMPGKLPRTRDGMSRNPREK